MLQPACLKHKHNNPQAQINQVNQETQNAIATKLPQQTHTNNGAKHAEFVKFNLAPSASNNQRGQATCSNQNQLQCIKSHQPILQPIKRYPSNQQHKLKIQKKTQSIMSTPKCSSRKNQHNCSKVENNDNELRTVPPRRDNAASKQSY